MFPARSISFLMHVLLVFIAVQTMRKVRKYSGEIMADAFKSAKQRIAKNVSSTGHLGPLLDLFSFVDKPSEIPYTPRKRKSKKRRTKERAKNRPDSGNNGHERKAKVEKKSSRPPQPATYP